MEKILGSQTTMIYYMIQYKFLNASTETQVLPNNGAYTFWGQDVMLKESNTHPGNRYT